MATTIDDIVGAAGTSRTTFYKHFPGKQNLVLALMKRQQEYATASFGELDDLLAENPDSASPVIRAWLRNWLKRWRDNLPVFTSIIEAASADPALAKRQFGATSEYMDALKHAPWNQTKPGANQMRERALLVECMTQRVFHFVATGTVVASDNVVLDLLTELWTDALGSSPDRR
jgi:AcrR family transcriptional regulator